MKLSMKQPRRAGGAKSKSRRQVGYLLSNDSPLTVAQKMKLKSELHSGAVKVRS